jgi:hypothetical protein
MPRKRTLQTTFIAGELAPELGGRVDTKQYANGAKSLLNRRCLIGGGTSRRPGTRDLNGLFGGGPRLVEFVVNENTQYICDFGTDLTTGQGFMNAYNPDGSYASGVVGAPWSGLVVNEMDFMQQANTMIVTHATFMPQVITRTGLASWTLHPIAFFSSGPRLEQPYFKLAPHTVTLQPDAYIGSINLTDNGGWLNTQHIGQRIRYLGREILITGISTPGVATGDVIERLPPSFVIGVQDGTVFTEGEVVLGADSGAKGVIVSITANELLVYSRNASITSSSGPGGATAGLQAGLALGFPGIDPFNLPGQVAGVSLQAFTVGEVLVGPNATSKITGVANSAPVAVPDWDEALFTPGNGFPSCVALHRNRLVFAGHPAAPNLLMASRLGNIFSFQVGDGSDADAILVTIGDSAAAEIRQLFSSDQLLLATDKGLYYVPEGPNQPFTPSRIAFIAFGSPWPISGSVKMRAFDDGVIAVSGNTVIKARGTGDSQKTWNAQEISLLSPHLLVNPYDMAVTTNFEGGPERYCVFSNSNGTLAVMMLVEGQEIRNFVPWNTTGFFGSVAVIKKRLYVAALRGSRPNFHLEMFDNTLTLDGVQDLSSEGEFPNIPTMFPGMTVEIVTTSGYALGPYPLHMDDVPLGPYHIGQFYQTRIQTLPASLEGPDGPMLGELSKINEAQIFTLESCRFAGNGYEQQAYLVSDDANLPPPRRSGAVRIKLLGWRVDPTLTISQPDPLPLTILAIKTEVVW